MYKKFKDCLLAPRNISDYIDEPKRKTALYSLILIILYVLPSVLVISFSNVLNSDLGKYLAADLYKNELHYEIKDNKLLKTDETIGIEYVKTQLLSDGLAVPAFFVFDLSGKNYLTELNFDKTSLVFVFSELDFEVMLIAGNTSSNNQQNPDVEQLSNEENNTMSLMKVSYEKLKIGDLNFSLAKNGDETIFNSEISSLVNSVYKYIKNKLLVFIIIYLLISGAISFFMSALFVAFLERIFYGYLQLPFGKFFKTSILCSTPYVICGIISSLTGIGIIELVGELIMLVYVTKALTAYKIKYGGGMPLPRYMRNMNVNNDQNENRNNDNIIDNDEKGSDDDEL